MGNTSLDGWQQVIALPLVTNITIRCCGTKPLGTS
jgi:hypothetical protein